MGNIGKKTFKSLPEHLFAPTKNLAANQGLYNGFLAAGLIWTLFIADPLWSTNIALFFLGCVVVAGSYGAITVFPNNSSKSTLALPTQRHQPSMD
jgi:putative membrane protein